ncbi:MAG: PepSY domain-containing protein [Gammaproteobacteria bacterium]|jgi:uncharacterized membrane protein YkoI
MGSRAALFAVFAAAVIAAALWAGFARRDETRQAQQPGDHQAHEAQEAGHGAETLDPEEQDRVLRLKRQGAILPLQDILERARRYHAGRVLETELEQKDGRYIYEIEVLDAQGRVWEMSFDAASGEFLEEEQEY